MWLTYLLTLACILSLAHCGWKYFAAVTDVSKTNNKKNWLQPFSAESRYSHSLRPTHHSILSAMQSAIVEWCFASGVCKIGLVINPGCEAILLLEPKGLSNFRKYRPGVNRFRFPPDKIRQRIGNLQRITRSLIFVDGRYCGYLLHFSDVFMYKKTTKKLLPASW